MKRAILLVCSWARPRRCRRHKWRPLPFQVTCFDEVQTPGLAGSDAADIIYGTARRRRHPGLGGRRHHLRDGRPGPDLRRSRQRPHLRWPRRGSPGRRLGRRPGLRPGGQRRIPARRRRQRRPRPGSRERRLHGDHRRRGGARPHRDRPDGLQRGLRRRRPGHHRLPPVASRHGHRPQVGRVRQSIRAAGYRRQGVRGGERVRLGIRRHHLGECSEPTACTGSGEPTPFRAAPATTTSTAGLSVGDWLEGDDGFDTCVDPDGFIVMDECEA